MFRSPTSDPLVVEGNVGPLPDITEFELRIRDWTFLE